MSTDGHFVFQHRDHATGEWSIINEIEFIPRNYLLYYALGNDQCATCPVSGNHEGGFIKAPLLAATGLPDDVVVNDQDYLADHELTDEELDSEEYPYVGEVHRGWCLSEPLLALLEKTDTVTEEGILSRRSYEAWDKVSQPDCYSYSVGGPRVVLVEDDETQMSKIPDWNYVKVRWSNSLKNYAELFYDIVKRLQSEYGEVRTLYGFSN